MDLFQALIPPIVLISLIPVYYFTKLYLRTRISDFAIFALTYLLVPIAGVAYFIELSEDHLILHQIIQFSLITAYILVMIIAVRMVWEQNFNKMHYLLIVWYTILVGLIALFELATQSNEVKWGTLSVDRTYSPYHPLGAQTELNGTIIYSTSHFLLGLVFILTILVITLVGIHRFEPVSPTKEIINVKNNWFRVLGVHTIGWLFYLPPLVDLAGFGQLLIFVSHLGIAYLVIKNPELVLINVAQIVNAMSMYKKILERQAVRKPDAAVASLVHYLESLPPEIITQIDLPKQTHS